MTDLKSVIERASGNLDPEWSKELARVEAARKPSRPTPLNQPSEHTPLQK